MRAETMAYAWTWPRPARSGSAGRPSRATPTRTWPPPIWPVSTRAERFPSAIRPYGSPQPPAAEELRRRLTHGRQNLGGVDELFEPHDPAAAHHEVMSDPYVDPLAGRPVGGGVAGEDHDVLAVHDVAVVVRGPAVPVLGEGFHDVGGDALGGPVGAGQREAGHLGPLHVGGEGGAQRGQVAGGRGQILAADDVGGRVGGGEVGQPHVISPFATLAPIW